MAPEGPENKGSWSEGFFAATLGALAALEFGVAGIKPSEAAEREYWRFATVKGKHPIAHSPRHPLTPSPQVAEAGLEPARELLPKDFKSLASANSATRPAIA